MERAEDRWRGRRIDGEGGGCSPVYLDSVIKKDAVHGFPDHIHPTK